MGSNYLFTEAMDSGYFDQVGKSKFESVFDHDFEDLLFLLGIRRGVS